jgi:hypothetical protein
VAILNSTLVGLFKAFYGRFAGTEGNLKTEVVDVNLLEVPDPRCLQEGIARRLMDALEQMSSREVGRLVEEQLMNCHSPNRARKIADGPITLPNELQKPDRQTLDDALFELLGVSDPHERREWIERLYEATARHFREIRVVEIEKMQQRAKTGKRRFNIQDMAADIWDAAGIEDTMPLADWIAQWPLPLSPVFIPEERPALPSNNQLFAPNTVYFGKSYTTSVEYPSSEHAELVVRLANLGIEGDLDLPTEPKECVTLLESLNERLKTARSRFNQLAASRTTDEAVRDRLTKLLERWYVLGRETPKADHEMELIDDLQEDS